MKVKTILGALLLAAQLWAGPPVIKSGPRPPVWKDNDTASIPEPAPFSDTLYFDFFHQTFGQAPKTFFSRAGGPQRAWNVNAWDEVPDSSWYTNRNHLRPMTAEEVRRGAACGAGPDLSGPLVVLRGKDAGTSPGFGPTRDARGNIYFIKFDSADYPELSTAAEVIGSRLFHAMGFHVPEEWIIHIRPEQIRLDPQATLWDETGRRRAMTQADLDDVLKRVARRPDGRNRAVASLSIPGKIKGEFLFQGTRRDDPNDLIPHQHRRELRGLRLFSAWLNHFDIRTGNTKDTYVEEEGRKFLRHYLLDFGSTLGSASYFPKTPRMGNSYVIDLEEMAVPFFTFGIRRPDWRARPVRVQFPTVGTFEGERFSPEDWKPVLPIAAFSHMDEADAFWAAKIVMSFTEEQIRAAVREGQLSDPRAEEYVVRTLLTRQRKIGDYAFARVSALDTFKVAETPLGPVLECEDLAVKHRFTDPANTWYYGAYDNQTRSARGPRIPLDGVGPKESQFVLHVGANVSDKRVKVYLERSGGKYRVLGWER